MYAWVIDFRSLSYRIPYGKRNGIRKYYSVLFGILSNIFVASKFFPFSCTIFAPDGKFCVHRRV